MKLVMIRATSGFIGSHRWENAPVRRQYLKTLHEHRFRVKAEMEVKHGDREVEFHDFRSQLDKLCYNMGQDMAPHFNATFSCEHIAEKILEELIREYGDDRCYHIEVGEDTFDNAAILEYEKQEL